MYIILYTKYRKSLLNKFMTKYWQHLSPDEHERLLARLGKFEDLFYGKLCAFNANRYIWNWRVAQNKCVWTHNQYQRHTIDGNYRVITLFYP